LEPEVIQDKVGNAKAMRRSKYMHEWTVEQLAAWFTELKMEQYIPFLFANRYISSLTRVNSLPYDRILIEIELMETYLSI